MIQGSGAAARAVRVIRPGRTTEEIGAGTADRSVGKPNSSGRPMNQAFHVPGRLDATVTSPTLKAELKIMYSLPTRCS